MVKEFSFKRNPATLGVVQGLNRIKKISKYYENRKGYLTAGNLKKGTNSTCSSNYLA